MELSIIVPAFNEERRLPRTLQALIGFFRDFPHPVELLIVDDGSTDRTAKLARRLLRRSRLPNRILQLKENMGKGAAVKLGMLEAKGKWRFLTDADLATPLEEFRRLWPRRREVPIVIGSRHKRFDAPRPRRTWKRRIFSKISNLLVQLFLWHGIVDNHCGFKLFRADVAESLFGRSRINGFGYDFEILKLARIDGHPIVEVGVDWQDVPGSKMNFPAALRTLRELFMVRLNLWAGRYRKARLASARYGEVVAD